ncbi:hypothetical protein BDP27DRAFT_1434605 [Rhodocollybia butyracea]|uniref:DUF6534 domain-containing protein n=1 Tax=Rhodocollybia butyracea TaxID=206335 RepID=A0A9P5TVP5_9AGAR|nr:hypothetical protein BDP27DRAFT_1434605 [Rhodocollybia butyracea]
MASIDNMMGAAFVGVAFACFLLGVSVLQSLHYFSNNNAQDPVAMRVFVLFIIVLDFSHQGLICHTLYVYVITGYDEPDELKTVVWSLLVEVLVNGLIAFSLFVMENLETPQFEYMAHGIRDDPGVFRARLYHRFDVGISFDLGNDGSQRLTCIWTFVELAVHLKGLSIAVNVLAAAGDVLIASSLACRLPRPGFESQSNMMINKLVGPIVSFLKPPHPSFLQTLFAVNTGALTSICAMASLVSILVFPATFVYISFFFCMGHLYTNSLLATLNARAGIRALGGIHTSDKDQSFLDLEGDTSLLKRLGMMSSSVVSLGRKRVPEAIAMVATEAEPYLPPTPPNSPCCVSVFFRI